MPESKARIVPRAPLESGSGVCSGRAQLRAGQRPRAAGGAVWGWLPTLRPAQWVGGLASQRHPLSVHVLLGSSGRIVGQDIPKSFLHLSLKSSQFTRLCQCLVCGILCHPSVYTRVFLVILSSMAG